MKKKIKNNHVFIIAEIGVNHCGKIKLAKKMIVSAKRAGADAVKFQTFKAESLALKNTPKVAYQKKNIPTSQSHFEMLKSLELSNKDHIELYKFCNKKKIKFLSTPYDISSARYLNKLGCDVFKVASADIVDLQLHSYLSKTKKKVIISTGMSNLDEINKCISIYKKNKNNKFILLHCVSNYPCSFESINMRAIKTLERKFNCQIGFSDHSLGNEAAIASVALGAKVIEKHFTINRKLPGPDQKASVLPEEFNELVNSIRKTEIILGSYEKICQSEEKKMLKISRKSLTLCVPIKKNEVLRKHYLTLKRPGTGLYYSNINDIVGKKAKRNLNMNYQVKKKDFY